MVWKARLLVGLMLVAIFMAIAGPAMADNDRDCINRHGDRFCEVDGDRNFHHHGDVDDDFDEVEVIFVPVGFWLFDDFWGWYWVTCGFDWDC